MALSLLVGAAPAAFAEPAEWDQERVTEVAVELHRQVRALRADPGLEPTQASEVQQRDHHAAVVTLGELEQWTRELSKKLRMGMGRDATGPIFGRAQEAARTVVGYSRSSWLPPSVRETGARIRALGAELDRYYESR